MNKMIIATIAAIMMIIATIGVIVAMILASCDKVENDKYQDLQKGWYYHGVYCRTKVVEIESHKYILMDGCDGGGIIHAASCECLKK